MKTTKRFWLLAASLLSLQMANAQNADDIIAKHIEAIGGKEKLAAVNSVKTESTMVVMGGEAPAVTTILNGKGYRNESDFNGMSIVQVVTDKSGWEINPMSGGSPQAMPEMFYKMFADQVYIFSLLDYNTRGSRAELLGQEKAGETNAYKIKLTSKDSVVSTYLIDASTYKIIQASKQSQMMGTPVEVVTTFSDYQPTEQGVLFPQTTEVNIGGQFTITSKVKKMEINTPVDVTIFEMK